MFGLGAIPAWWTNTLASVLRGGGQHALAARVLALQWAAMPVAAWLLAEPADPGLIHTDPVGRGGGLGPGPAGQPDHRDRHRPVAPSRAGDGGGLWHRRPAEVSGDPAGLARLSIATVGGGLLAQTSALGTDGHFLGVALGISAYGLITASGVRPSVWRMSRPTTG